MKTAFWTAIVALATSVYAVPVAEANANANAEADVEARAEKSFSFWVDAGFKGAKETKFNDGTGQCFRMDSGFYKKVSSAGPTSNLVCSLWSGDNCNGNHVTIRNPGVSDLRSVNFNDVAASWQCLPT